LGSALPPSEPGHILVRFKDPEWLGVKLALWIDGAKCVQEIEDIQVQRVKLSKGRSIAEALAYYRSLPQVEFAEPNYRIQASFTPNDPSYPSQYAHQKIRSASAWDVYQGSATIKIAIIDTGVDAQHPDIQGKVVPGYDFVNNDAQPHDDHGHGTHCAGIAAAQTNNGTGISGVGFNCSIMPIKVLGANGSGYLSHVASGITWATNQGAKVLSLSLGSASSSTTLQQAVDFAWNNGAVVIVAAGNTGDTRLQYPAAYPNAIAVASTDANDMRSSFSTYGNWVDVAAPGTSILSTVPGGGYQSWSGTSMACPAVAGLAGLLFGYLGPQATPIQVRQRIENNCDPVGTFVLFGRINAFRALTQIAPISLSSLSINVPSILAGQSATGTVTLTANAPQGGISVNLTRNSSAVTIPASVSVPAGQLTANFTIGTSIVSFPTQATITASHSGVSKQATLTVQPAPKVQAFVLSTSAIRGPATITGTITLTAAAPAGGTTVVLTTDKPTIIGLPQSVVVPSGQSSTQVTINIQPVYGRQSCVLTAAAGGAFKQAWLTVMQ